MSLEKASTDQVVAAVIKAMAQVGERPILDRKWDGRSTFAVHEAAEILGISPWAAYRGVKNGNIPATRIGKRLVVPRHALERKLGA
jgi:excisionase family DNA binding protein